MQTERLPFQQAESRKAVHGQHGSYHTPAYLRGEGEQQHQLLIATAVRELVSAKATLAVIQAKMTRLAQQLPEYETVQAMYSVGETTTVQLMTEIGDVRRFPHRSSIVSYADVNLAVDESPASTSPRATLRPIVGRHACVRHCIRLSVFTCARPPLTSRYTSS